MDCSFDLLSEARTQDPFAFGEPPLISSTSHDEFISQLLLLGLTVNPDNFVRRPGIAGLDLIVVEFGTITDFRLQYT